MIPPSTLAERSFAISFVRKVLPNQRKTQSHKIVDNIFHDHTNTKITEITKTLGHPRSSGRTGGHGPCSRPRVDGRRALGPRPGRRRSRRCRRNVTGKSETSRHRDTSHEIAPKENVFVTRLCPQAHATNQLRTRGHCASPECRTVRGYELRGTFS